MGETARPLAQDGVTGLIVAARIGDVEMARLLLDRGASVDAANKVLLHTHVLPVKIKIKSFSH